MAQQEAVEESAGGSPGKGRLFQWPRRSNPKYGAGYANLWSASVISELGDGVRFAALPLLAAQITRDPLIISGISIAGGLPWLILALPAGAIVDRVDRRRLMVWVQAIRTIVMLAFAIWASASLPPIASIYVVVATITVCEVFFASAAPSLLPNIVPSEKLGPANASLFGGRIVAGEMVGPPLGGFLVAAAAAAGAFFIDGATFLLAAVFIAVIPGRFAPEPEQDEEPVSMTQSIGQGLRWIWGNRFMRTLVFGSGVANLARAMMTSIYVLFSLQILHVSGFWYGVLWGTTAVGAVVGSLISGKLERFNGAKLIIVGMAVHGASTATIGLSSNVYVVGTASFCFGVAVMAWSVVASSARQRIIPDHLRGRVNSVDNLVGWGAGPIGALLGGVLGKTFGLRVPIIAGGTLVLITVLLLGPLLYRELARETT